MADRRIRRRYGHTAPRTTVLSVDARRFSSPRTKHLACDLIPAAALICLAGDDLRHAQRRRLERSAVGAALDSPAWSCSVSRCSEWPAFRLFRRLPGAATAH